ncbi:MAG: hypothetical protein AAFS10_04725 [Myxococcota bacterium]
MGDRNPTGGRLKVTGYIKETRHVPVFSSQPARARLDALVKSTRLSNAREVYHENIGLVFYLGLTLTLVYIFTFSFTALCLKLLGLDWVWLRSGLAWFTTVAALISMGASLEHSRPGLLRRLALQVTIPVLGWPRQVQRNWQRQLLKVPVDIEFNLEGEQPSIRWRARREDGALIKTDLLSRMPRRVSPPPGLSRHGAIALLQDGLTLELTRDPLIEGRAHLRLRSPSSLDALDLELNMDEEHLEMLSPMARSGVRLGEAQMRVVEEVVQIALSLGSRVPPALRNQRPSSQHQVAAAEEVVSCPQLG